VLDALTARASWPGGHDHSRDRATRQREWPTDPNKQGRHRLSGLGEMDVRVAAGERECSGATTCQRPFRWKQKIEGNLLRRGEQQKRAEWTIPDSLPEDHKILPKLLADKSDAPLLKAAAAPSVDRPRPMSRH